jgi:predicted glycosyltransferase
MASIPRSTADSGARDRGHVLVLGGAGGEGWDFEMINRAAEETPLWDWTVVGPTRGKVSERVQHLGWLDDTYDLIASADVVVASAGDATVNEVMSLSRPIVCIPEARPFQEQVSKARKLHEVGAVISVETWPEAGLWPSILQKALGLDCSIHRTLVDGWGAQRAAAYLDELAARFADIGSLDLARQRGAKDLDAFSFRTPLYEAHFGKGG